MLPVRVLHQFGSQFYGYGPSGQEIEALTSCHKKGKESMSMIHMFGKHWLPDSGHYIWDGVVYMTWKRVEG